jgi:hypothetical protein
LEDDDDRVVPGGGVVDVDAALGPGDDVESMGVPLSAVGATDVSVPAPGSDGGAGVPPIGGIVVVVGAEEPAGCGIDGAMDVVDAASDGDAVVGASVGPFVFNVVGATDEGDAVVGALDDGAAVGALDDGADVGALVGERVGDADVGAVVDGADVGVLDVGAADGAADVGALEDGADVGTLVGTLVSAVGTVGGGPDVGKAVVGGGMLGGGKIGLAVVGGGVVSGCGVVEICAPTNESKAHVAKTRHHT